MDKTEVIIACHNPDRPVARAVASVWEGNGEAASLTVVCHNTDPEGIMAQIPGEHRKKTRFLELQDQIKSPAGPFSFGMKQSRQAYVSLLGSDDVLEPGACENWLSRAQSTGADAVITRLRRGLETPRLVPTPPLRPFTCRSFFRPLAHPVKDRLFYRSAPLGLVSCQAISRLGLHLAPGLPVGEDVPFVTKLWALGRITVCRRAPGYLIGEDATDRVTYHPRPIKAELAHINYLYEQDWFRELDVSLKQAIGIKTLRIYVFGAVFGRGFSEFWTQTERKDLRDIVLMLEAACPGFSTALSRADQRVKDAIVNLETPASDLIQAAAARRRHLSLPALTPGSWSQFWHREAPLRFMAASLFA